MNNFEIIAQSNLQGLVLTSKQFLVRVSISGFTVKVYYAPFSNCQIFSIGAFRNLFLVKKDYDKVVDKINEIRKLCGISKELCQIDIHKQLFEEIKQYINIHASMEYINLTGSKMVSVIIKL